MIGSARLLLLAALPALLGEGAGVVGGAGGEVVSLTGREAAGAGAPVFAPRQRTRVRGVEGHGVTLQCRVQHLGDKAVSWVRVRDLQILTHSGVVFTMDSRVSVPPPAAVRASTRTYALRIDRLRANDAGRYECQLNTEPKMSLFFDLLIVDEAEAESDMPETLTELYPWEEDEVEVWAVDDQVHVAAGGRAELACEARVLSKPLGADAAPPFDIRWLRAGKPLTLQDGYTVLRLSQAAHAESRLRLSDARASDAGEYQCAVGPRSATLHLTVTDQEIVGEMEMQRDQWAGGAGGGAGLTPAPLATALAALLLLTRLVVI